MNEAIPLMQHSSTSCLFCFAESVFNHRFCFLCSASRIKIEGSIVIPVPLFHVLDGKNSRDYVARVEPSAVGGHKIAEFLLDVIKRPHETVKLIDKTHVTAPRNALISERK